MTMSGEEQCYIVEQIDKLIQLAQEVMYQRLEGPQKLFEEAEAALEKQRRYLESIMA